MAKTDDPNEGGGRPAPSMSRPVAMNKASVKALAREARRDMQNSLEERGLFKSEPNARPEVAVEYEVKMLEAADVLGALGRVKFDRTGAPPVSFSPEALTWIRRAHEECAGHLESLDEGDEAGYSYNAKEAYLVHVLGRIVAAQDGGRS